MRERDAEKDAARVAEDLIALLPSDSEARDIAEIDILGGEYEAAIFVALDELSELTAEVPPELTDAAHHHCARRWGGNPKMMQFIDQKIASISA